VRGGKAGGRDSRSAARTGWFGEFGGRFAPETLVPALRELSAAHAAVRRDSSFRRELGRLLRDYAGRPTPLFRADRLGRALGGRFRVWLKREDLAHTGSHKINNALGQCLLARRMGKPRVIAETGAGQHGVATATCAALLGMSCDIFMGTEDMERQRLNVWRMRLLGARVVPVDSGTRTLKDAINEAFRDWVTTVRSTYYVFGSVAGPHPYPSIVAEFQSIIGREARAQFRSATGKLPTHVIACVGGGSNAAGIFRAFMKDRSVMLVGVEAAGSGLATGRHAATLSRGRPGILHGSMSYVLQDRHGQVLPTHSISAGLDYPGVGPEHSHLMRTGRASYASATDREAIEGFRLLSAQEGILPALESAHAVGYLARMRRSLPGGARILLNLSGRGDKDVETAGRALLDGGVKR